MVRNVFATVAVGAGVLVTVGCGAAAEKVAEEATERAVEDQTGGSAEVDLDDGSFTVDGEDGSVAVGTGEVPEAWPDDVPVLDEIEVLGSTSTSDATSGEIVTVSGTTSLTADEVVAAYRDALPGWEVEAESTQGAADGGFATVVLRDGARTFSASVAFGEGSDTSVNLSHTSGA